MARDSTGNWRGFTDQFEQKVVLPPSKKYNLSDWETLYWAEKAIAMKKMLDKYRAHFSEGAFLKKLGQWAKKAGIKIVYTALLLYYAYQRKDTPGWAKKMITGVLAYFIIPADFVPDLTPYFGLTDDLSILAIGLTTVGVYVNKDVKEKSRAKLATWFNDVDPAIIEEVESGIKDDSDTEN